MKKQSFLYNLFLVSATSVFLGELSLLFRFYLADRISAEGMGLYQLIISVYTFGATAASSGLSFTVTRFVSEAIATERRRDVANIMRGVFLFATIPAILSTALLWFFSGQAATLFIGEPETAKCLRILAFSFPFMSAAACFSGFFVAVRKVQFSSVTQITEDVFQIAVTFVLLEVFKPQNAVAACVFAVVGCTSAEAVAAVVSAFLCLKTGIGVFEKNRFSFSVCTAVAKTALPLSFSACLRSALTTAENLLIPVSLQKSGMSRQTALATVGTVKGLVFPLISFPSVAVVAFARLLLPEIGDFRATGNKEKIVRSADAVLSFTVTFSLLLSVIFFVFADDVGVLIHNDPEFFKTLKILSPLIPFTYVDCISDSILKGLDMQLTVMKYSITEAIVRTAAVLIIIPKTGFVGMIITLYAGNVINSVLGIIKLKKTGATSLSFWKKIFSALLLYLPLTYAVSSVLQRITITILAKISVIFITAIFCVFITFLTGAVTPKEKAEMKKLLLKK